MAFDLLLAIDDPGLAHELRARGHAVAVIDEAREALAALRAKPFDAAIVTHDGARLDGIAFVQEIRAGGLTLPILMLGSGELSDCVEALEAGADDYRARPVTAEEVAARLAALVRGRRWATRPADTLAAGDIVVAPASFRAWRAGRPLDLPRLEFALLVELARGAGQVLTRAALIERVWGYDRPPATNILDVHVRRLRLKLAEGGGADPIVTMRGVGYMLRE